MTTKGIYSCVCQQEFLLSLTSLPTFISFALQTGIGAVFVIFIVIFILCMVAIYGGINPDGIVLRKTYIVRNSTPPRRTTVEPSTVLPTVTIINTDFSIVTGTENSSSTNVKGIDSYDNITSLSTVIVDQNSTSTEAILDEHQLTTTTPMPDLSSYTSDKYFISNTETSSTNAVTESQLDQGADIGVTPLRHARHRTMKFYRWKSFRPLMFNE